MTIQGIIITVSLVVFYPYYSFVLKHLYNGIQDWRKR